MTSVCAYCAVPGSSMSRRPGTASRPPARRDVQERPAGPERGARGLELVAVEREALQVVAGEQLGVVAGRVLERAEDRRPSRRARGRARCGRPWRRAGRAGPASFWSPRASVTTSGTELAGGGVRARSSASRSSVAQRRRPEARAAPRRAAPGARKPRARGLAQLVERAVGRPPRAVERAVERPCGSRPRGAGCRSRPRRAWPAASGTGADLLAERVVALALELRSTSSGRPR